MIDFLRNWILGITASSILMAAVQRIIPQGSVKKVGNMVCGLILLLSIANPISKLEGIDISGELTKQKTQPSMNIEILKKENDELIKKIIEDQTCAYISDKATELGISCKVQVEYSYSTDGIADLVSVIIEGSLSNEQRENLSRYLMEEFSISEEQQIYKGVADYEERRSENAGS